MAHHQHTDTQRSADSYEPSSVRADDDGTWRVQVAANEQFGEGLALVCAAAWLAHHREHTLRELSYNWDADDDSGELDASVELVVIANMNNRTSLRCTASRCQAGRLINAVMSEALAEPRQ